VPRHERKSFPAQRRTNEARRRTLTALEALKGQPADKVVEAFTSIWATVLTRSRLEAGCAIVAITLASDSPVLRERAGEIFEAWRDLLRRILAEGGVLRCRRFEPCHPDQ